MHFKVSNKKGSGPLRGCGALALCMAATAAAAASGPQLSDLAPVKLYPVALPSVEAPMPLPEPGSAAPEAYSILPDVPDVPYDYFWTGDDWASGRQASYSVSGTGLVGPLERKRKFAARSRWLPTASTDPWTLGSRNWRYSDAEGLDVTLGNEEIEIPAWGRAVRLGGVSLSQSSLVSSDYVDSWQYSLSLGALDRSTAEQGDLEYGETAGNLVLRYGVNKDLSIESQTQVAPEMVAHGVGGKYETDWGAWSAGVARATQGLYKGWRYQAAYTVNVLDDLEVSWRNERYTPGFVDLSRYGADLSSGGTVQALSAKMLLGRWGDLSGTFENESSSSGAVRRSFGLTQQFWYSPNLRIGLRAEREIVSGDYDIGIRFSVPIY